MKKVIVQGITGSEGWKHTKRMLAAGTEIVGGVNPHKAGEKLVAEFELDKKAQVKELPVFANCQDAIAQTEATVSVVFVPPAFAKSAVLEAVDAGFELVVVITEGIPVQDSAEFVAAAKLKGVQIVGPNCPGVILNRENIGIIPDGLCKDGPIGLVSKSGTLTYQFLADVNEIGVKTAFGIGGDPIIGTSHIDSLQHFENDDDVKLIVLIGEIGGSAEEEAADYISQNITKPVIAYIAGVTAPEGKTMGHAGAIVSAGSGTALSKQSALEKAGVKVAKTPSETASFAKQVAIELGVLND